MAEITTILGTDSLSSSRIVINDNFDNLNTELLKIMNSLDPDGGTLNLSGNITSGGTLTITGKFIVGSSSITATLPIAVGKLTLNSGIIHSTPTTALTASSLSSYDYTTYPIGNISTFDPGTGTNGVEITLISTVTSVSITTTLIAGTSSITLPVNSSLTLRWWNTSWYIVSQFGATIS